jgi:hypothetical protein
MQRFTIPGMIVVGLLLVALGTQWNRLQPASNYWSDKQAAEYNEAQVALHMHSHEHGKEKNSAKSPDFVSAKQRYDKIKADLEGARNSRNRTGNLLIAAGLIAAISGIVLHFRGQASTK